MHLLERSSDEVIEHVGATAVLKYHIPHLVNYLSCSNGKERSGERGGGGGKRREGRCGGKKKRGEGRVQLRDATRGEGGRRILEGDEQDHAFHYMVCPSLRVEDKGCFCSEHMPTHHIHAHTNHMPRNMHMDNTQAHTHAYHINANTHMHVHVHSLCTCMRVCVVCACVYLYVRALFKQ